MLVQAAWFGVAPSIGLFAILGCAMGRGPQGAGSSDPLGFIDSAPVSPWSTLEVYPGLGVK